MGDLPVSDVSGAGGAQHLIEQARIDAARIRAEAVSEARRRAQEADLLIAKARRVLVAAEQKAAVIVINAQAEAERVSGQVVDLTGDIGRVIAPTASRISAPSHTARLDKMLASAINNAVADAFPVAETG